MGNSRDPKKPFFAVFDIGNLDGTFDSSTFAAYDHEHESRARMVDEAIDLKDNLPHVVFLCIPMLIHRRQPMLIEELPLTPMLKRKARKA